MKSVLSVLLASILLAPPAWAGEIDDYFVEACNLWHVPQRLARAIAQVESGGHPWAVNVEGRGFRPRSREEAGALIDEAWRRGESFDIGLMQVNSFWLRKYGLEPRLLLEPRENVIMGTWILSKEIERFGLSWRAVASYHTPVGKNPGRGRAYAMNVIKSIYRDNRGR